MPITKSAKKALRASRHKRVFNMRRKSTLRDEMKKVEKLVAAGKKDEAQTALGSAYKAIDKAAKRGVIAKNTAARKKSRLARLIKR